MKSKFLKKKSQPGLMLTSLLDMFTIILIFLIVSFEAEDHDFQLEDTIELPESSSRSVFKPAVNVTVTEEALIVEKETILELDDGRPPAANYEDGRIPQLVERLEVNFERFQKKREAEPDLEAIILVQADKKLDYDTLYVVLRSASLAGFSKYRLATMKK